MKDWLIGTGLVLTIPVVTGLTWFLLSLVMGPNVLGALLSLAAGGLFFRWLLKYLNKREWDKVLRR